MRAGGMLLARAKLPLRRVDFRKKTVAFRRGFHMGDLQSRRHRHGSLEYTAAADHHDLIDAALSRITTRGAERRIETCRDLRTRRGHGKIAAQYDVSASRQRLADRFKCMPSHDDRSVDGE